MKIKFTEMRSLLGLKELGFLSEKLQIEFLKVYTFSIIQSVLQILSSLSLLPFISFLLNSDSESKFHSLYLLLNRKEFLTKDAFIFFLGILMIVFQILSSFINARSIHQRQSYILKINHFFSTKLVHHYLEKDLIYYSTQNIGIISKSIIQDTQLLSGVLYQSILDLYVHGTLIFLFVFSLILINPIFSFLLLMFISLFSAITIIITRSKLLKLSETVNRENKLRSKYISEIFNNIKIIKSYSLEKYFESKYEKVSEQYVNKDLSAQQLNDLPKHLIEAMTFSSLLLMVMIYRQFEGNLIAVIPYLSVYLISLYRVLPSLYKISQSMSNRFFASKVKQEVYSILNETTPQFIKSDSNFKISFKSMINFESVGFKYPDRNRYAIEDLKFELKKGTIVGLVGHSGGGKSTFIDLLLKLQVPTQGQIYLDGKNIQDIENMKYLSLFGYVPQETLILDASIWENIVIGEEIISVDFDRLNSVLKDVELFDFIYNELPKNVYTIIGEKGIMISGGQRQRISLARALYRDPKILILDEATNALDYATEMQILDVVKKLKVIGKTVLMVTHKVENLEMCDNVYEIKNGTIYERTTSSN